jgi:hypothetical protein
LNDLKLLKQERANLEPAEFTALVNVIVPADLLRDFNTVTEAAAVEASQSKTAATNS